MRMLSLLILLTPSPLWSGDAVTLVKQGSLGAKSDIAIGLIFSHYKWFKATEWTETKTESGQVMVQFTGIIDDEAAVKAFDEENRYRFSFAFKAMQLEPVYGITKNKQQVAYQLNFKITGKRTFELKDGALGVMENGAWRYVTFSEKALDSVIAGIYANEAPYTSLVKGLPYR